MAAHTPDTISKESGSATRTVARLEPVLFAIILLAAAFLRLYRLDSVPPGLTHDEADTGYFVAAVYRGEPAQVEAPYGYANEPFAQYSGAVFMALVGPTDLALRLHSVFFGMLLLVFTYLWARSVFGVGVALGSAALIAVSFWTVAVSRFALNPEPAPALFTGAVYFLWVALRGGRKRRWAWAPFAFLLAGSLYAYEAARAAAIGLILFVAYLAVFGPELLRRSGLWFAGALAVAGLLAAPHLLDPAAWARSMTQSGPLRSALRGDLAPLVTNAVTALGTFTFRGDSFVTYNLPGRPIFDPLVSLFFCAGIVWSLIRWRKPAYAFVLIWLVVGISPSLAIGEWTSTLHSMAAQAPIMVLPAIAAVEVARAIKKRLGARWETRFIAFCAAWLAVVAVSTGYDYFGRWAGSPHTRAAYFQNLVSISDYLDDGEYSGAVALSSPFPEQPLDPFIADLRMRRDGILLRWFDGRRAIVFPDISSSLLVVPPSTPLDPYIDARLPLGVPDRVHLRPDDTDPYFDVYEWEPQVALSHFMQTPAGSVTAGDRSLALPVNFGGVVELVSYEVLGANAAPGGEVTVATVWRVVDPGLLWPVADDAYGPSAAIFVHMLGPEGGIVAQEDRLDAPAWNWQSGDTFVQVHRLTLESGLTPGSYPLAVGVSSSDGTSRLPVLAGSSVLDDRVLLPPVEVAER